MRNQLFVQRGGEGVASWVRLVAMIGAIALVLTTMAIAPSQARADEDQTVDAPQEQMVADLPESEEVATSEVVPSRVDTFEDIPALDEDEGESFFPETDVLDSELPVPSQEPRAGPSFNDDINVTVDSITSVDKDSETLQVGDDVSIKGTWDALLADPLDGTKFWVTFPTSVLADLKVKSPTSGTSEVTSEGDGEVIGFEVDTELLGESGKWEVVAKVIAATSDTALNFLTSTSTQDISVNLPGEEGIVESVSKARAFSTLSDDGILVGNIVIENDTENGQQLQPGQIAKISGTWAAPDAATGGETFVVEIPAVFGITPIAEFSLVGEDGLEYGTCNVSETDNTMTCVLSDAVEGLNDVHGEWHLWVAADQRTTEKEVDFIIDGGDPISVPLPGEAGGIGRITPIPTTPSKSGSKIGQQGIRWTVDIPGSYLAENNVPNPATFVDTPSGGQQVVADSGLLQFYDEVNGSGTPQNVRDHEVGTVDLSDQDEQGAFDITLNPGEEWDPFKVYRIQYKTKTDELLDPSTALTNSIGIGEGPGIGGNSLHPTWKTGRQVDGSYQAIEWTILAPAREAIDGTLTITDIFEDSALPHSALDSETIDSLSVTGPNGDVTGDLSLDDTKNITITFPVSEAVEDANGVYTVKYTTYYDGTDDYPLGTLPQGGKRFENEATVGSVEVKAHVQTPGWGSSKDGKLNSEPVIIDGVTHPMNSTLDWTIKASGNLIADLEAPVTITDKLTGDHQVCEGTGSVEDRLNLTFEVWDRVSNSAVEDSGVTVEATIGDDDTITYELTSETGEFSRSHEYRIGYTTCTTSGGQDPVGTKYGNTVEGSGIEAKREVTLSGGGGGTGTGVSQGSFSLLKKQDFGSEDIDPALEFTVRVEEFRPGADLATAKPDEDYEVKVKANGEHVSGHFSRGNGWTIRLTEIGFPDASGVYFDEPGRFVESEGVEVTEDGSALVSITPRQNVEVQLFNKAHLGSASITKVVKGDAADDATGIKFPIVAYIDEDGAGPKNARQESFTLKNGETYSFEDLPIGTVITFEEGELTNTDKITWGAPKFSPERLVVGRDVAKNSVTLTNTAGNTEGTFSVQKIVKGNQSENPNVPENFKVIATWGDNESTTLTIPTNGDLVSYDGKIPAGTEVTLSEVLPENGNGITWGTPTFSGAGIRAVDGNAVFTVGLDPINIKIKNYANNHVGDLRIDKKVVGDAAETAAGAKFALTARIDNEADGQVDEQRLFTLEDGEFWLLKDLPIGAEVTFSEALPANSDAVTWGNPSFEPSATVTVDSDSEATLVTLTNTADVTEGTFSLKKKLSGPEEYNKNIPEHFDVLATWIVAGGDEQSKTLTLPSNGDAIELGENLPAGTKVTLTEILPEDGNGLAWGTAGYTVPTDENGNGVVTIGLNDQTIKVKNYVDTNDGILKVIKSVTGEAAEAVGDDVKFQVKAEWSTATGYDEEILTIIPGQPTKLEAELPVGTEVKLTELERPEVDLVDWGAISWDTNAGDGEQWMSAEGESVSVKISDESDPVRLVTLGNEALWKPGSVEFQKFILDEDDKLTPAADADLPAEAEFEVLIEDIQPELVDDVDFPAVGDTVTLNAENGFVWTSDKVLPKDTVVTFSELDPAPLPGIDWARPHYSVEVDAGKPGHRNTVEIEADGEAEVQIQNRPTPTTEVDIDKIVTGPKGKQVERDDSTLFQVTASWTDAEGEDRTCVLNVVPGQSAVPTAACDATVIDGKVYFPLNTEITFIETGANTDVSNVKWGEVLWTTTTGEAELTKIEGQDTGVSVILTGDANDPVTLGLENKTSSSGLIIIPLPIPLPPFNGGSSVPPTPTDPTSPVDPSKPVKPSKPGEPGKPGEPTKPGKPGEPTEPSKPGKPGHPGKPSPVDKGNPSKAAAAESGKGGGLASTGANVAWLAGGGLLLLIGGAWFALRGRKNES